QRGDHGVGVVIVGRNHGVDVRVGGVLLVERGGRHRRGPRAGRFPDLHVRPVVEHGLQDAVVALGEQGGVVVGGVAVHHQDVRLGHLPRRDAVDLALADQVPDLDIVEADVGAPGGAALHQAVVVDDLHALGGRVGLDGGAAPRV